MSEFYDPRTARPAKHVDRRARAGSSSDPTELPSLGEVERRIMQIDDELAKLVEEHYGAAEQAAVAEADWKGHRDRVLVGIADRGDKEAADIREARAKCSLVDPLDPHSASGDDLYRLYKIYEAREKSIDRHIRAVQTRATALMSVAKGIRGVT
jgi:hypothetical protein